jgi:hypothetical protein
MEDNYAYFIKRLHELKAVLRQDSLQSIKDPQAIKAKKEAIKEILEIRAACESLLKVRPEEWRIIH